LYDYSSRSKIDPQLLLKLAAIHRSPKLRGHRLPDFQRREGVGSVDDTAAVEIGEAVVKRADLAVGIAVERRQLRKARLARIQPREL